MSTEQLVRLAWMERATKNLGDTYAANLHPEQPRVLRTRPRAARPPVDPERRTAARTEDVAAGGPSRAGCVGDIRARGGEKTEASEGRLMRRGEAGRIW